MIENTQRLQAARLGFIELGRHTRQRPALPLNLCDAEPLAAILHQGERSIQRLRGAPILASHACRNTEAQERVGHPSCVAKLGPKREARSEQRGSRLELE